MVLSNRFVATLTVILLLLVVFPVFAFAVALPGPIVPCDGTSVGGGTECTVCHIAKLANNVLNTGIYVAIFLSAILFAWAGWKYLTNAANPGQESQAKEIFLNVLIGLVIILGGWLVIDTLMRTLVNNKTWNVICNNTASISIESTRA